jgi:toxin YoeB
MRNLTLEPRAISDLQQIATRDKKLFLRCMRILEESARSPFEGIGKPEALKGNL